MPVDVASLSVDETIEVFNACVSELTFDQVWAALMATWTDDDKEEAHARLSDELDTETGN